jgi:hypothetical protein
MLPDERKPPRPQGLRRLRVVRPTEIFSSSSHPWKARTETVEHVTPFMAFTPVNRPGFFGGVFY